MNLENFCFDHGLGKVIHISPLSGGFMHKMFQVKTDKGIYAIKILNPEVMSRSEAYDNFVISEAISNLAKDHGICVSSAILIDGNYLTKYDDMYYMVFDFVYGKTLIDKEITVEHCMKIGQILSQIHSLDYQYLELKSNSESSSNLYDWEVYIKHSDFDYMSYKKKYLENYKKYNSLFKRAKERLCESNIETSICHNDLDPKNVMWNGMDPIVIDWESANLANPYRELIDTALRWSGFLSKKFDEKKFTAIIKEYIKIKPIEHDFYSTICGNLVGSFEWLKYNLERSLGICSDDLEEKKLAENEVEKTIDEINYYIELIGKMYEILCNLTKPINRNYDDTIETIIAHHEILFHQEYELIPAGFTNTIYKVGNYVVRICTDFDNESNFKNEIEFYQKHVGNPYIPYMYFANTSKRVVSYCYEILERIDGQTLYELWYQLSHEERQQIVQKMVDVIKSFHLSPVPEVDFKKYIKDKISNLLKKSELNEEIFLSLLNQCDVYFEENKLGFVHRDLHFDNFIYHNGKITLLDFERSMVGAIDYDLRIFSRYKDTPWLWASAKTDMLTVEADYQDFMEMLLDYYEELRNIPYLQERLKVYEIIDLLNGYCKHKEKNQLEEVRRRVFELLPMRGEEI